MMGFEIRRYEEIDSTNAEARRLSRAGVLREATDVSDGERREGLVVVAERQTAGRGRRGRSWESASPENLYFSLLLKPEIVPEKAPMLTLVMAYSVARAIVSLLEQHEFQDVIQSEVGVLQIKWPNDLVIDGKKICGILTEMHLGEGVCQEHTSEIEDVIIGVGVNVNGVTFPEELAGTATSLTLAAGEVRGKKCDKKCNKEFDKEVLLQNILREFEQQYAEFLKVQDLSFLQEEYNALLVNGKKEVRVLEPGQEYHGVALGINEKGELLVQKEDGSVEAVYAGEVSVRGIYGYV